jgi:mannose-6-phosphate isomerase
MHHLTLTRGQAIFVASGEVHAYLRGFGLEVMLPSDNVIRAGLTTKHIDVEAFLQIARLESSDSPPVLAPSVRRGCRVFTPRGAAFMVTHVSREGSVEVGTGAVVIQESDSAFMAGQAHSLQITQGDVFFATQDESVVHITGAGDTWVVQPVSGDI